MNGVADFFANDRVRKMPRKIETEVPEIKEVKPNKTAPVKVNIPKHTAPVEHRAEQRLYPKRTFDAYPKKTIQIREEDFVLIEELVSMISAAKKNIPEHLRNRQRITSNTIIRKIIQNFSETATSSDLNIDFTKVQTEEELGSFINGLVNT